MIFLFQALTILIISVHNAERVSPEQLHLQTRFTTPRATWIGLSLQEPKQWSDICNWLTPNVPSSSAIAALAAGPCELERVLLPGTCEVEDTVLTGHAEAWLRDEWGCIKVTAK